MSVQAELHKLIYDQLKGAAAVMALVNGIYDDVPADAWGEKLGYVSFGPSYGVEDDADCIIGSEFTRQLDCWSRRPGSVHCEEMVDAVKRALHDQPLELSVNALVSLRVVLTRVFRDPDGETTHGVVQLRALVEENE